MKTDFYFYDVNGFIHDNPEADSNNPWIYSSYNFLLTGRFIFGWRLYWRDCLANIDDKIYYIYRKPNDPTPPLSRDEAIGQDILGMPIYELLVENDFYLCRKEFVENINWIEAFIDLIKVAYETRNLKGSNKRNYIWKHQRKAMKISFKLMPHDIFYFKRENGGKTSVFEEILFYLYVILSAIQKNYSARNVCWAQLKQIGSKFLIKLFNQKENFKRYFVKNHPLVIMDA